MNLFLRFCVKAMALLVVATAPAWATSDLPNGGSGSRSDDTNAFARAPYLQLATPNSIVIVWRTEGPIQPAVRYGSSVDKLDRRSSSLTTVTRVALTTNKAELKLLEEEQPELFRLPKLPSAPAGQFQSEVGLTEF